MKLGIISDTHGNLDATAAAVEVFREMNVTHILHCGDIGTTETVRLFDPDVPAEFVFGNCDVNTDALKETIHELGFICHDWFGTVTLEGKAVAFLHGHRHRQFEHELHGGRWDLFCYGHTHIADLRQCGKTLLLNPGAIHRCVQPSVAVVDPSDMSVRTCFVRKSF